MAFFTAETYCWLLVAVEMSAPWLRNRKIVYADGPLVTVSLPWSSPLTWSPDRSSATCESPFWTFSTWVAACTLRITIVSYAGLAGPLYAGLRASTAWLATSSDLSVYGPDPAEVPLRNFSAPSVSSVVPPFAVTTFELTIDSAGLGRMYGRAAFGSALVSTTVESSFLATVTPSSRNDGLPFTPITRCSEKTTSSAVTGLPSEDTHPADRVR